MQTAPKSLHRSFETVPLGSVVKINPHRDLNERAADKPTSFIPMAAIDDRSGLISDLQALPYSRVRKGYTFFRENDVLFAKITPCMENGKVAIARGAIDGIGFGTTEFHVLRAGPLVMPEWVYYFLRWPDVRKDAADHFVGAVGQQRVPADWLANVGLPLPSLDEQERLTEKLKGGISKIQRALRINDAQSTLAKSLRLSIIEEQFRTAERNDISLVKIGDIVKPRNEIIHPRDKPTGVRTFVGLEHIEPNSGRRFGSAEIDLAKMPGRRATFKHGDIIYGYLRPYLNKVWIAEFDGLCSVDQYVFIVDSVRALPEYVATYMRSGLFLERAPINTTPGQLPRIRSEEVAEVPIPLPSLVEQDRIIKQLHAKTSEATCLAANFEQKRADLQEISSALLRAAFSGQL